MITIKNKYTATKKRTIKCLKLKRETLWERLKESTKLYKT